MAHIKITKGLDIPITGKPHGKATLLTPGGEVAPLITPPQIALNLQGYEDLKLRLLVKVGDTVKMGQPLVEDKSTPGRYFVSPAGGVVKDIRRGLKRVLRDIIIEVARQEEKVNFDPFDVRKATQEQLIKRLLAGGLFAKIKSRPFNLLADPKIAPKAIFIKALESAPLAPPSELQVLGHEKAFQAGLSALSKLTKGTVHLVYHVDSHLKAFIDAQDVEKHTAEGPHPIANSSLHIQKIDRLRSLDDVLWTLTALDVVSIGYLLEEGKYHTERVVSIGGPGILPDRVGFFKIREGYPIGALTAGRIKKGAIRLISGDPLLGHKVAIDDFLGMQDTIFCAIPENESREFLHFFRLGTNKYSFSRAYLTGHWDNTNQEYDFTTNQHGEHRPFIDSSLYDKVMPLEIPTMQLVKALMAEDYELADAYGLLEVDSEDFALPTFVCPSKMEMVDIVKKGIKQYAKEVLS